MTTEVGPGRLRRAFHRLSATPDEMEAEELQVERVHQGCKQIKTLTDREHVTLFGHVKDVTLAPRAGTPTLEASLFDGSGVVTLIWLGRRTIPGIKPGVSLKTWGRVSCHAGRRFIYNPRYEIRVDS